MDHPFGYIVGDTWRYLEELDGREGWNGGWDRQGAWPACIPL